MQVVAVHSIHTLDAKGKEFIVEPGKTHDFDKEEALRLISLGAAVRPKDAADSVVSEAAKAPAESDEDDSEENDEGDDTDEVPDYKSMKKAALYKYALEIEAEVTEDNNMKELVKAVEARLAVLAAEAEKEEL